MREVNLPLKFANEIRILKIICFRYIIQSIGGGGGGGLSIALRQTQIHVMLEYYAQAWSIKGLHGFPF